MTAFWSIADERRQTNDRFISEWSIVIDNIIKECRYCGDGVLRAGAGGNVLTSGHFVRSPDAVQVPLWGPTRTVSCPRSTIITSRRSCFVTNETTRVV